MLWLWNLWCYQNNNENFHRTISAAELKIDLILTCGVSITVTQELVPFSFPVTVKRFWFVLRAVPDTVFFFGCHRPTGSSRKLLKRQRPFLIYLACSLLFLWKHLYFSCPKNISEAMKSGAAGWMLLLCILLNLPHTTVQKCDFWSKCLMNYHQKQLL